MASAAMKIPISDVMKNVTCEITLTGMKTWKVRFSAGVLLFRLAAWVIGMKGEIKVGDQTLGTIV